MLVIDQEVPHQEIPQESGERMKGGDETVPRCRHVRVISVLPARGESRGGWLGHRGGKSSPYSQRLGGDTEVMIGWDMI